MKNLSCCFCVSLIFLLSSCSISEEKVHVVDLIKVFNGYDLKIEMERSDSVYLNKKILQIDSLKAIIELKKNTISHEEYMQNMIHLNASVEKEFEKSNERINEAVWKNINKHVKDFGKQNNMKIILGANGTGNVMFYSDQIDVTTDLIEYLNNNYENGK